MNKLSTQEHKPLGYLEVEDGDKVVRIPYYHEPGICGCTTCRLARGEISVDFFKGYHLAQYLEKLYAQPEDTPTNKTVNDEFVKPFFTDDEIIDYIMNV